MIISLWGFPLSQLSSRLSQFGRSGLGSPQSWAAAGCQGPSRAISNVFDILQGYSRSPLNSSYIHPAGPRGLKICLRPPGTSGGPREDIKQPTTARGPRPPILSPRWPGTGLGLTHVGLGHLGAVWDSWGPTEESVLA